MAPDDGYFAPNVRCRDDYQAPTVKSRASFAQTGISKAILHFGSSLTQGFFEIILGSAGKDH